MINLRLPKQHYLGNLPGRLIFLYSSAATIFGIIGLVLNSSTWFMVATSYFKISLPIWIFYAALLASIPAVIICYWVFITPSQISVGNEQSCKHNNPAYDEILALKADIKLIKKKLEIEE